VDLRKALNFKTYATHQLPHARAIAVEKVIANFGVSVLQRIDAELSPARPKYSARPASGFGIPIVKRHRPSACTHVDGD